jgi:NAD+ kinase
LVTHTGRADSTDWARRVAVQLLAAGFGVRVLAAEAGDLELPEVRSVPLEGAAEGAEIVLALGGDGTLLRAAEAARPAGVPLMGVNLGRLGFLAEAELDDLDDAVKRVAAAAYEVDERLTVDVTVSHQGRVIGETWALNEASVEKWQRERMIEVLVAVDDRPLTRWGCDGMICATPTGSTAYALSAGGPLVWPEVEALLLVPISAYALFSRPLVIAPGSTVSITVESHSGSATLCCDGRRTIEVPTGAEVRVRRGGLPVRVARLGHLTFTERLVAKFGLPVDGWRR